MPFPFIIGAAIGAMGVLAYQNKDKIQAKAKAAKDSELVKAAKDAACSSKDKVIAAAKQAKVGTANAAQKLADSLKSEPLQASANGNKAKK